MGGGEGRVGTVRVGNMRVFWDSVLYACMFPHIFRMYGAETDNTITCRVPQCSVLGLLLFYYISVISLMSQIYYCLFYLLMTLMYLYVANTWMN